MRVIIPAAGNGVRFKDAGYRVPKPCIPVCGVPMLRLALEAVYKVDRSPIVLCQEQHRREVGKAVANAAPAIVPYIFDISHPQQGAALTVLCANSLLADDDPVLVMDCDNLYDATALSAFVEFINRHELAKDCSAIMTRIVTSDMDPATRYSYVVADEKDRVVGVYEKTKVSTRATCGVYFFQNWRTLRAGICKMVALQMAVLGEYYLAPVYNFIRQGNPIFCFDVPPSAVQHVGTPEELKAYEEAYCAGKQTATKS